MREGPVPLFRPLRRYLGVPLFLDRAGGMGLMVSEVRVS